MFTDYVKIIVKAGFWLVTSFLEIDEKTTLKSWTIMETLIGVTALIVSFIVSIFA